MKTPKPFFFSFWAQTTPANGEDNPLRDLDEHARLMTNPQLLM
jgi:hypothetical protein